MNVEYTDWIESTSFQEVMDNEANKAGHSNNESDSNGILYECINGRQSVSQAWLLLSSSSKVCLLLSCITSLDMS